MILGAFRTFPTRELSAFSTHRYNVRKLMSTASERPNLLLITTDQQRFDTIHAAGNQAIFTPHLNWLCDTGIRFSRAYADTPVCAPSRATIMTGLHAYHHGQTTNTSSTSPMARLPTLPGLLTRGGYQTRLIGKAHFHPVRARYGFEHAEILPDYYRWIARQPNAAPPKDHGVGENEMEPVFSTTEERFTQTHWVVERAIDFLETRDDTAPFFLWMSFGKPHPPFDPLARYWNLYDGIDMPEPVFGDWSRAPDAIPAGFMQPTWHLNNAQRFSPAQLRAVRRAYYACITQIDYNLGLLFARLREMRLQENTWIIFTSDHGEMLGDHHMGAKSTFFEGSAHVPLLVRPPERLRDAQRQCGAVDDRLACLADVLPTLLSRAGLPLPARCDGLDLLGEHRRQLLLGESGPFHLAMDRRHKYTFAANGGGELLFDLHHDPLEQHNLMPDAIADPSTPAGVALAELRARLVESLRTRGHPAAASGTLAPTAPPPTPQLVRQNLWPGLHHRTDPNCDLLH